MLNYNILIESAAVTESESRCCVGGINNKQTLLSYENAWLLVWRSGNGVRHINEVKLHRAWLALGW